MNELERYANILKECQEKADKNCPQHNDCVKLAFLKILAQLGDRSLIVPNCNECNWIGNNVKYPCRNCVYIDVCGNNMRTEPCSGRMTKSQKKGIDKNGMA